MDRLHGQKLMPYVYNCMKVLGYSFLNDRLDFVEGAYISLAETQVT